jgi:hypothetical protein
MAVLVSTGLVGRFLYQLVPVQEGRLLKLEELERKVRGLRAQISSLLEGSEMSWAVVEEQTNPGFQAPNLVNLVMGAPVSTLRARIELRKARRFFGNEARYLDFARSYLALRKVRLQVSFYTALRRWMEIWRVLHVGLSLFMVIMIAAHIGVSLYLGYSLNVFRH